MKKWQTQALIALLLCCASPMYAEVKIGVVNFKKCVEESKLGKQEQAAFEAMKKQMEAVVEEKEKVLNDLATKLNDPDQLDLMSPEAETEMKRKFRALSQELSQLQSQYYQALQQANFKIVQKISDTISSSASKVAQAQGIDVVLNDETSFYANPKLDISNLVVKQMDVQFAEDVKQTSTQKAP